MPRRRLRTFTLWTGVLLSLLGLVLSIMLWAATYFFSIAIICDSRTVWEFSKGCVGRNTPIFSAAPFVQGGIGANAIYDLSTIHRFWKSRRQSAARSGP